MRYLITMTVDIEEVRQGPQTRKVPAEPVKEPKPQPQEQHASFAIKPMAYGIKDAARILGISRSSIYHLMKEGTLNPIKIGRRCLFLEQDLKALLEKATRHQA